MSVPYPRRFRYGDAGPDVEAVGRALSRAGFGPRLTLFNLQPKRIRRRWGSSKQRALRQFKRKHHLKYDFNYGETVHHKLSPYFDRRARALIAESKKPNPHQAAYQHLLRVMQQMSKATHGYSYGAGHGPDLRDIPYSASLDCSSSVSKALHDAGMWKGHYAMVSGDIAMHYGEPGKGRYFTVYAHSGHAWIRLHRGRWWRFDTSAWGSGGSGGKLRYTPRPTWGFTARHWPGM